MKVKYDDKVDAAYIYFKEKPTQVTTLRVTEDIAIDFGPGEEIVGIEVLDASKHLGLNPKRPQVKLENLGLYRLDRFQKKNRYKTSF